MFCWFYLNMFCPFSVKTFLQKFSFKCPMFPELAVVFSLLLTGIRGICGRNFHASGRCRICNRNFHVSDEIYGICEGYVKWLELAKYRVEIPFQVAEICGFYDLRSGVLTQMMEFLVLVKGMLIASDRNLWSEFLCWWRYLWNLRRKISLQKSGIWVVYSLPLGTYLCCNIDFYTKLLHLLIMGNDFQ